MPTAPRPPRPSKSLPHSSRKSVLLVFREVLKGNSNRHFTQNFLKDRLEISQAPQTRALLSFLGLVDSQNKLTQEVMKSVFDRSKFTKLLEKQINDGYQGFGFSESEIWSETSAGLKDRRGSIIKKTKIDIEPKRWTDVIACLVALRELTSKEFDEQWMNMEIRRHRIKSGQSQKTAISKRVPTSEMTIVENSGSAHGRASTPVNDGSSREHDRTAERGIAASQLPPATVSPVRSNLLPTQTTFQVLEGRVVINDVLFEGTGTFTFPA